MDTMNRTRFTACCLVLGLSLAGCASTPPPSGPQRAAQAVGNAIERGASAASAGIQKGVAAAERGVRTGVAAAARGVERGAEATAEAAETVERKVRP
jgi:hypothetical protein